MLYWGSTGGQGLVEGTKPSWGDGWEGQDFPQEHTPGEAPTRLTGGSPGRDGGEAGKGRGHQDLKKPRLFEELPVAPQDREKLRPCSWAGALHAMTKGSFYPQETGSQ